MTVKHQPVEKSQHPEEGGGEEDVKGLDWLGFEDGTALHYI